MNDDLDPAPPAADAPAPARDTSPPAGVSERPYECATARYWPHLHDPRAGKRYAGHHAEILQEQGTLARVAVYPPGRSQQPGVRPVTMWIDLASPEQCDAGPGSLTTIRTGDGPKRGALFLISGQLSSELSIHGRGRAEPAQTWFLRGGLAVDVDDEQAV